MMTVKQFWNDYNDDQTKKNSIKNLNTVWMTSNWAINIGGGECVISEH